MAKGGGGIPAGTLKPNARQDAALAYAPFANPAHRGAYVFGGNGGPAGFLDDLWRLVLSKTPDGQRSALWTYVEPPDPKTPTNWPSKRYEAGLAWTGTHLLLFGGLSPSGAPLDDTWRFDGTTWQLVCQGAGCFPLRRAFSVASRGPETSPEVLAFGGMEVTLAPEPALELTNRFVRFTGTGWQPINEPIPAELPTLLDGTPSFQEGSTAPLGRFSAWAAASTNGQVLVGSGQSSLDGLADDDGFDVWRLTTRATARFWSRVPVTTARPGRRLSGSAVFDPVRQETLVVGGIRDLGSTTNPTIVYNTDPPVAYKGRGAGASMRVTCIDPDGDGDCNEYALEAQATIAGDTTPSRVRAVFLRQTGHSWGGAGPGCGTNDAPLAPGADGIIRCNATADALNDRGFAVQIRDAGYATGGALCSPTPSDSLPFCNAPNLYAGTLACTSLPFEHGDTISCP